MAIRLQAAGAKDVGRVREMNEDEFFIRVSQSSHAEPTGLFIVADGMGGHAGGEIASKWAVQAILAELEPLVTPPDPRKTMKFNTSELEAEAQGQAAPTRLLGETKVELMIQRAVERANEVVIQTAQKKPAEAADAGCTITLAVVQGSKVYIANVGDSRTYLFRKDALSFVTTDHSVVARLVATQQIQPDDIYTHPQRSIIYRSLGNKPQVEVDLFQKPLQAGDRLLLCSDGLWEMVRTPQIAKIMEKAPDPTSACERLIKAANDNGGEDNIGVVVVWID